MKRSTSSTVGKTRVAATEPVAATVHRRSRPGRPAQAERTEEARIRIIDAAFECLAEKGYQHTVMTEIAKRAGCSRELPRYHFGTKEKLMEVLIDEVRIFAIDMFTTQLEENTTALEALYKIADVLASAFEPGAVRLRGFAVLLFGAADPGNKALYKKIVVTQRQTRAIFKEIIVKHLDQHPELGPRDADAMAALVYAILRGFTYQWLIDRKSISVEPMFREFKRICPELLNGKQ